MSIRVGLVLVVGWLSMFPSRGFAQNCTLGPFTSATSLSSISSQINGAPDGAVACMKSGNTWSGGTGLTLTTSHSNASRVTICTSDTTQCRPSSDSSNAVVNITGTGNCFRFNGISGYNVKNINCTANSQGIAYDIQKPSSHLTVEGGVIDGWFGPIFADNGSGAIVDDIKLGTCANRMEIRNGPSSFPPDNRYVSWGAYTNSSISMWIHNFVGSHTNAQDHMLDIAQNGTLTPYTSTQNLTVECSLIQFSGGNLGSWVKIDRGTNITIRDNTFEVLGGVGCDGFALAFNNHDSAGTEGVDGAAVYRNMFKMGRCGVIENDIGRNIDIYNNVATLTANDTQRGLVQLWYNTGGADDLQIANVRIFNNTVYRTGNSSQVGNGYPALVSDNGAPAAAGRTPCTGCAVYNNLAYDTDAVDAKIWSADKTGCNGYGTNGANIKNNFIYTPNDSTPKMWSGCSAASGTNAAPYNTNPGLVDPANGNFALATGSVLSGTGISAGAPTNGDFLGNARPSPPSIGAFDLVGAGGVTPLQPPTLIQLSTN